MKTEFDLKRADRDAALYNTDGRLFDLLETGDRLEIVARPTAFVLWGWTIMASIMVGYFLVRLLPTATLLAWQKYLLLGVTWTMIDHLLQRIINRNGKLEPKCWVADKDTGQFCADEQPIAQLDEIVAVRGQNSRWKTQSGGSKRFRLSLQLRDGRQIRLGLWKFAGKEWAWRQDAAQIAAFVNVPLEIPLAMPE